MTFRELVKVVSAVDFDAAMKLDEGRVSRDIEQCDKASDALLEAFKWKDTPEGFWYWNEVHEKLEARERDELCKSA